ncbi:apolipoprotein N-acyltransferase [Niastella yeongjuensis]|uniref:Apolipoprotein N-acyltransferase n=1 Tax=Niastella yeongjuensis TaxID=354355 RepID=A0A1V9E1N7_9BACT|nr:apolipoprotein N-acyltransferase [Niastella yeongjuensis]OQP40043.1 apolipoprotein N-acyltransferase [Niastella yeongjuensis]SEO14591.1 apolipoprotein N-acyltransferase [Niastella yeongjuensis]
MNRYKQIGGAIISGLCLFIAVQHAVFILGWIALVPVFSLQWQVISPKPSRQSFFSGFILGGTVSCCAFAWMINGVPAFTGLSVGYGIAAFLICTLFFALGCALVLWLAFLIPNPLYIAAIWALAEFVLQGAAGGLPWFLFHAGNALSANLYAIQPVSVIGVTGCSFLIVLVNALIAKAIAQRRYKQLWLPGSLFTAFMGWGWLLLVLFDHSNNNTAQQATFRLALLQQHIPPNLQWDEANGNALVQQLLQQERRCIVQHPNMILWSESAIPWTYSPDDDLVRELLHNSDTARITHILGMNTAVTSDVVGNSAYCLLPGGRLAGRYDKATPLVFIERPWQGLLLPFFSANGYSVLPGNNQLPLFTPYGKAGILICNESVLPQAAASTVRQGAQFLLNLSNDGWFRNTYLVNSHFYNARLRAVETRKDLAINSNNGRCGLVSASGRIDDGELVTIRPNTIKTIAVRFPQLPACICLLLLITTIFIHQKTKLT